jgi:protein-tyrosine phosphatase
MWFRKRSSPALEAEAPHPGAVGVLMVCMGNICRSPTAEAVLRARLRAAGLQRHVRVDSAGMSSHHEGEAPDPRAIRHAAARGYELAVLRSRPVMAEDFRRHRYLLAMDEDNLRWLEKEMPADAPAQISLLLTHAPHLGVREVPDPYYGPPAGFERVLDLVEAGCDGFVQRLLSTERFDQPVS